MSNAIHAILSDKSIVMERVLHTYNQLMNRTAKCHLLTPPINGHQQLVSEELTPVKSLGDRQTKGIHQCAPGDQEK